MVDTMEGKCVVLITGGSGFLGQHVIKLLNTHAEHVTSIRVVDLVPFEIKLDYTPTKPIHSFVGSINDEDVMREAMKGCHCVIHLAGIADYSMFPNREKLETVSVRDESLSTVVLRPPSLYGELDTNYVPINLRLAKKCGGVLYPVNLGDSIHQHAYVGNVAWAFICAEKKLYDEQKAMSKSIAKDEKGEDKRSKVNDTITDPNDVVSEESNKFKSMAGQACFIADDTPNQNAFQFMEVFLTACGFRISKLKIPHNLVLLQLYLIHFLFYFLSLFGIKLNMEFSVPTLRYLNSTITVTYEKAKKEMGYVPLFTPEKSAERSALFYKEYVKTNLTTVKK